MIIFRQELLFISLKFIKTYILQDGFENENYCTLPQIDIQLITRSTFRSLAILNSSNAVRLYVIKGLVHHHNNFTFHIQRHRASVESFQTSQIPQIASTIQYTNRLIFTLCSFVYDDLGNPTKMESWILWILSCIYRSVLLSHFC